MSVSLQHQLTKGDYFYTEVGLYYVEVVIDESYLVENCKTYDHFWVKEADLDILEWYPVGFDEEVE